MHSPQSTDRCPKSFTIRQWLAAPIPSSHKELEEHVSLLLRYVELEGDMNALLELGHYHYLAHKKPVHDHPVYLAAYNFAAKFYNNQGSEGANGRSLSPSEGIQ